MKQLLMMSMLVAAACASGAPQHASTAANTPVPPGSNVDHDDDVRCNVEVPTGSQMSRPVCRSDLQREEDMRQADSLQKHQQQLR